MSQTTVPTQHPAVVLRSQYRNVRALLLVAMFAVIGLSATTAILAIDDNGTTNTSTTNRSPLSQIEHALRGRTNFEVRPSESGVAAAIAPAPSVATPDRSKAAWSTATHHTATAPSAARPDESTVAEAISRASHSGPVTRPDESTVAEAVSGANRSDLITRPDESNVASAISGR